MIVTDTIRLMLADVDGTLVTPDKELTDGAVVAVRRLGEAGILFAITSGRSGGWALTRRALPPVPRALRGAA
jgi:hydroxymethylpyrimidine pyrophosphatase-like HAD family hydrolase